MWAFSVSQILREIKIGESIFYFIEFLQFLSVEIYQKVKKLKLTASKNSKVAVFELHKIDFT